MNREMGDIGGPAVLITGGLLTHTTGKTAHGLIRGSARFEILGVIDSVSAGRDAGEVLDGRRRNIPVYATLDEFFARCDRKPDYAVFGGAFAGGKLPAHLRPLVLAALETGLSVVCGLHQYLGEDPEFAAAAQKNGAKIYDVRKPRPKEELKFWTGEIFSVKTPRIAVLGMDCACGKRTTAGMLVEMCRANGIKADMIYTGQTGWMQGYRYGFLFDATPNDFISGEIERAIVECDRLVRPDLIFIEGQSGLRNPSGPCGSEFILSANAKDVVLQHVPFRKKYEETSCLMPTVESEIELIKMYGARTIAVTLNGSGGTDQQLIEYQRQLARRLDCPIVRPVREGVEALLPILRDIAGT